jgi:PilZ domain
MKNVEQSPDTASSNVGSRDDARIEQRKHQRFPTRLRVRIHWTDDSGTLLNAPGIVKDVSAGGFGIELDRPFSIGELLSVETHVGSLQCIVRHTQENAGTCRVGVHVLAASDGSDHRRSLDNLATALAESRG